MRNSYQLLYLIFLVRYDHKPYHRINLKHSFEFPMARQASPVILKIYLYIFKYIYTHFSPFNYAELNFRSEGKATQRLSRNRIGYPTYPSAETDLLLGLCLEGQPRSDV